MEFTVVMFFTQFNDIRFPHQRFAAGIHIEINTQFFSLCDDPVQIFVGQVQFVTVLCCPTAGTVQVTGAGRIHQDQPRNIALMCLSHRTDRFCPVKCRFKTKIQCRLFDHIRMDLIQCTVDILHPLGFRIPDQISCTHIRFCREIIPHKFFRQIYQL